METAGVVVTTYVVQNEGGWVPFSIPNSSFTLNSLPAFFFKRSCFDWDKKPWYFYIFNTRKWLNLHNFSAGSHGVELKSKLEKKTESSVVNVYF